MHSQSWSSFQLTGICKPQPTNWKKGITKKGLLRPDYSVHGLEKKSLSVAARLLANRKFYWHYQTLSFFGYLDVNLQ